METTETNHNNETQIKSSNARDSQSNKVTYHLINVLKKKHVKKKERKKKKKEKTLLYQDNDVDSPNSLYPYPHIHSVPPMLDIYDVAHSLSPKEM